MKLAEMSVVHLADRWVVYLVAPLVDCSDILLVDNLVVVTAVKKASWWVEMWEQM